MGCHHFLRRRRTKSRKLQPLQELQPPNSPLPQRRRGEGRRKQQPLQLLLQQLQQKRQLLQQQKRQPLPQPRSQVTTTTSIPPQRILQIRGHAPVFAWRIEFPVFAKPFTT